MLSEVLGEKLHSAAFAELVVDEHGELALVPLSPLWGLSGFIKNNDIGKVKVRQNEGLLSDSPVHDADSSLVW